MTAQYIISRDFHGNIIDQRAIDKYFDATAMCKATGKRWFDYHRLDNTKAFISALSVKTGIDAMGNNDGLIQSIKGGDDLSKTGTWVHPYIAVHLAQWCNPEFAVQVSEWVFKLMATSAATNNQATQSVLQLDLPFDDIFLRYQRIAKASGQTNEQAVLSAGKATEAKVGFNPLADLGLLNEPQQMQLPEIGPDFNESILNWLDSCCDFIPNQKTLITKVLFPNYKAYCDQKSYSYISFYYFSQEICKIAKYRGHSVHKTRRSKGTLMVGLAIKESVGQ